MRPVDDLKFHIGGSTYRFLPMAARPHDMPHLMLLFTALTVANRTGPFDAQGFVDEQGLWHCFEVA